MKATPEAASQGRGKTAPPISDYAIIGDCETAALINSQGEIDWLCLPAFDAPSFFGTLVDAEKGGEFVVKPTGDYRVERSYLGDTAILQTQFIMDRGTVLLTDFFVIARQRKARFYDFTSLQPTRKLVRLIELVSGEGVEMQVRIAARPDYARRAVEWHNIDGGLACAEATIFSDAALDGKGRMLPPLQAGDIGAQFSVERGRRSHIVLDYSEERTAPAEKQIDQWLAVTRAFWEEWNLFNYYRGRHCDVVRRSAVTLKLLTYAPTGAFARRADDLCRKKWAARTTGITASRGCATPRSSSTRSFASATPAKRKRFSPISRNTAARMVRSTCRCCFRFGKKPRSPSRRSIISRGIAARNRSGAATARLHNFSSITAGTFCNRSSSGSTPAASSTERSVTSRWPVGRLSERGGVSRITESGKKRSSEDSLTERLLPGSRACRLRSRTRPQR